MAVQLNFTNFLTTLSNLESAKVSREAQKVATEATRLSNDRTQKDDFINSLASKGYIGLDQDGVSLNRDKVSNFMQDVPAYMKALNYDENYLGSYTEDGVLKQGRLLAPTQYQDAKVPSSVKKRLAAEYGGVENIPPEVLKQNSINNTISLNIQRKGDGKIAPVTVNRSSDPDDEILILSQEEFLDTLEGSLQGVFGASRSDTTTALASSGLIQREGQQAAKNYETEIKNSIGEFVKDPNFAGKPEQVEGMGELLAAKQKSKTPEQREKDQNVDLGLEKVTIAPLAADQRIIDRQAAKEEPFFGKQAPTTTTTPTTGKINQLQTEKADLERQLNEAETGLVKRKLDRKIKAIDEEIAGIPKKREALVKRKEVLEKDLKNKDLNVRARSVKEQAIATIDKQLQEIDGAPAEQNRLANTNLPTTTDVDLGSEDVQTNAKKPETLSEVQKFLQENEVNSLQEFIDKTKSGIISKAEANAAAAVIAIATSPNSRINQNQLFEQLTNVVSTGMPGSSELDVKNYELNVRKFQQTLKEYADTQEAEFREDLTALYTTAGKEGGFTSAEFIQQMKSVVPVLLEQKRLNQLSTTEKELIDGIIAQAILKRAQEEGPEDWSDMWGDWFLRGAADDTLGNSFEGLRVKYDSKGKPQSIQFVEKRGAGAVPLEESISWDDVTAFFNDSRIENYILSRALRIN